MKITWLLKFYSIIALEIDSLEKFSIYMQFIMKLTAVISCESYVIIIIVQKTAKSRIFLEIASS